MLSINLYDLLTEAWLYSYIVYNYTCPIEGIIVAVNVFFCAVMKAYKTYDLKQRSCTSCTPVIL